MRVVPSFLPVVSLTSLLSLAACASSGGTTPPPVGATSPTSAKSVAAPPPPAEAKRLSTMLVGRWKGTASMTMEGKTSPVDLEIDCTETSAGWGVTCHCAGVDPAGVRHDETHLWGYSADGAKVHFFAVTTDGDTHDHAGTFSDRGVAVEYRGTMGDKPMVESITFDAAGPSTMRFHNETKVAGATFLTFDATLRK